MNTNLSDVKKMASDAISEISQNITVKLFLKGGDEKGYSIHDFKTSFHQYIDYKGQPQSEVDGGITTFAMTQIPDDFLNKWMLSSSQKADGFFEFRMGEKKPLIMVFEEAFCIDYQKTGSAYSSSGVVSRLTLSPRFVHLNEAKLENKWRKS